MEYVRGSSVADTLKERGPLSIPAAAGLTCHVLRGLSFAHALGFVHRDIKPANLLTTKQDGKSRALLADFGLAKIYQESSLSGMSVTGQMGGTLAYMPPEQITHFREARPPADIYAIGATLYTLLTGRAIFDFKGRPEQQVTRILFEAPTPIQAHRPEIPDGLAEIIHRSLAKAPADRFPDARAMKDALAPFARAR
jgi:serine/threonine protein kinase